MTARGVDVRVEVLSDHAGAQWNRTAHRLQETEAALAAENDRLRQAERSLRESRHAKGLWRRVLRVATGEERTATARVEGARQDVTRTADDRRRLDRRERQQAAGVHGEDLLERGLAGLDDRWVMLRGYRNRRGETDHVLVGPLGVWAVEVKRRRVRLHVEGDRWLAERLDAYGNVVGSEPATDATGRTWGRQVGDVAADLSAWLARNGHAVPVRTAVILLHAQAQFGRIAGPGVDLIGSRPSHLVDALGRWAAPLTPADVDEIVALVRRDHAFHERRRRAGGRR